MRVTPRWRKFGLTSSVSLLSSAAITKSFSNSVRTRAGGVEKGKIVGYLSTPKVVLTQARGPKL